MTTEQVIGINQELFYTSLLVAMPALLVSLAIGLLVSIFQTVTSIQDQTLSYVPRIIVVGLVIVVSLGFSLQMAVEFARRMMGHAVAAGTGVGVNH